MNVSEIYDLVGPYATISVFYRYHEQAETLVSFGEAIDCQAPGFIQVKTFYEFKNKRNSEVVEFLDRVYGFIGDFPPNIALVYCAALYRSKEYDRYLSVIDNVLEMDHKEEHAELVDTLIDLKTYARQMGGVR